MLQNVEHCNCRKIQYKNYSILGSGVPGNWVTLTTVEGTVIPSPSSHLLPAEGILNRAIKYRLSGARYGKQQYGNRTDRAR